MAEDNNTLLAQTIALELALANVVCGVLDGEDLSPDDQSFLREHVARHAQVVLSAVETGGSDGRKGALDVILGAQLTHLASAIAELDEQ